MLFQNIPLKRIANILTIVVEETEKPIENTVGLLEYAWSQQQFEQRKIGPDLEILRILKEDEEPFFCLW